MDNVIKGLAVPVLISTVLIVALALTGRAMTKPVTGRGPTRKEE